MKYTPEQFTPTGNEIIVYGTNQFAQHNGGAARFALGHGAIYGDCPIGLCGNTYGIITTSFNEVVVDAKFIEKQIQVLYQFAFLRPELSFFVTKIGTGIAGFSMEDISGIFKSIFITPSNIILPKEFTAL